MKNTISDFVKSLGISVYRFRKDTGMGASTAYELVNDPSRIPNAEVMERICSTYKVQPGEFIVWIPSDNADKQEDDGASDLSKSSPEDSLND